MNQARSLDFVRLGLRFAILSFPIAVALCGCDDSESTLLATQSGQGAGAPNTSAGGSSASISGGGTTANGHAGTQGVAGHVNGGTGGTSGIGGYTGGVAASAGAANGGSAGADSSGSSGAGGSAGKAGSGNGGASGSGVAGASGLGGSNRGVAGASGSGGSTAGASGVGGGTAGASGSAGGANGGSSGASDGGSAGAGGFAGASAGAGGSAAGGTDVTGGWIQMANGLPSGFISVLVADPLTAGTLYAASWDGGGIFKTTNSGALWTHASNGLSNRAIQCIAIDKANTNVVYTGTEGGAFKSIDGGLSWTPFDFGAPDNQFVSVIAVDPSDSSSIYVYASVNGWIAGGPSPSLHHTKDGGLTWSALDIPTSTYAWDFVIDPKSSSHLFLSSYPGGLYVSNDSGSTWTLVPGQSQGGTILEFAYEPSEDILCAVSGQLVATSKAGGPWMQSIEEAVGSIHIGDGPIFYAAGQDGVYRSPDCFTWTLTDPRQTYVVTTDASSAAYAGQFDFQNDDTGGGVIRSPDGIAPWVTATAGLANGSVPALIVDPKDPDTLFVTAYERGVYKSTDGAVTWKPANGSPNAFGVPTASPTFLVTDGTDLFATLLLGKVGVYRTTDAGDDWTKATLLNADGTHYEAVFQLALDPLYESNGTLFGASGYGLQTSTDRGATWTAKMSLPWSTRVVADPFNEGRLWAGGLLTAPLGTPAATNVLVSDDWGDTWSAVALPVTGKVTQLAVASVPADGSTVYATIDGAGLVKTTDAGADWTLIGKPPGDVYTALAIDPTDADAIYVGSGTSPLPIFGAGEIAKSTDGGVSWKTLPIAGRPLAIAIDPSQPKTIYAGMQYEGVYKSTTGGE